MARNRKDTMRLLPQTADAPQRYHCQCNYRQIISPLTVFKWHGSVVCRVLNLALIDVETASLNCLLFETPSILLGIVFVCLNLLLDIVMEF